MKHPLRAPVILRGCQKESPAYRFGIRFGDLGWVVAHEPYYGPCGGCQDASECSIAEFVNDAGFHIRLCVQDVHLQRCRPS